jgi:hypothetical protein
LSEVRFLTCRVGLLWFPYCCSPSSLGYLVTSSNSMKYSTASSIDWSFLLSSTWTLAFPFTSPSKNLETRSSCFVKLSLFGYALL